MLVQFHDSIPDDKIDFAVIAAVFNGQWLFCRHRDRLTYEIPGGHREPGEIPLATACRELEEETGATDYDIRPICFYSVTATPSEGAPTRTTYGLLCYADIQMLGPLPHFEMAEVIPLSPESLRPQDWTYPDIQPHLLAKVQSVVLS